MNSTHARAGTLVVALVACIAAVAVTQGMHRQSMRGVQAMAPTSTATSSSSSSSISTPTPAAAHWRLENDRSVPDAAAVFAAWPDAKVEAEAPTF